MAKKAAVAEETNEPQVIDVNLDELPPGPPKKLSAKMKLAVANELISRLAPVADSKGLGWLLREWNAIKDLPEA